MSDDQREPPSAPYKTIRAECKLCPLSIKVMIWQNKEDLELYVSHIQSIVNSFMDSHGITRHSINVDRYTVKVE